MVFFPDKQELKHWSLYTFICALPNFMIAYGIGYNRLESILGMLFAIGCFIFVYSSICSARIFKEGQRANKFRKAVKLGTKIRTLVSFAGIIGSLCPLLFPVAGSFLALTLTYPDMLAGILALSITKIFFNYNLEGTSYYSSDVVEGFYDFNLLGRLDAFIPTVVTTVTEGLIISLSIIIISYIIVWFRLIVRKFRN